MPPNAPLYDLDPFPPSLADGEPPVTQCTVLASCEVVAEMDRRLATVPRTTDPHDVLAVARRCLQQTGLGWLEDSRSWEKLTFFIDQFHAEPLSRHDVMLIVYTWIYIEHSSGRLDLRKPFIGQDARVRFSAKVVEAGKSLYLRGRVGHNILEEWVRDSITDQTEDAFGRACPVRRSERLASSELLARYRSEHPDDTRGDGDIASNILSAIAKVFSAAIASKRVGFCHCILNPETGKFRRGWKGLKWEKPIRQSTSHLGEVNHGPLAE